MLKFLISFTILLIVLCLALVILAANSRNRRVLTTTDRLPELTDDFVSKPLVHSRASNLDRYIAPFVYCDPEIVLRIAKSKGWTVLRQTQRFLHFECRTAVFGFADDVYMEFDPLSQQIYVCSRSRIGASDFGTNRRRMETLRKDLLSLKPLTVSITAPKLHASSTALASPMAKNQGN